MKLANLIVDDDRVLNLLIRLGYLVRIEGTYFLTELGESSELGIAGGIVKKTIKASIEKP